MPLRDVTSPDILHASAVALGGRGLLICGPSGSGKSGLALSLMALGADLVADDRVSLSHRDGLPWMSAPSGLPRLIEARGLGLLNAEPVPGAWVCAVVDLDSVETDRLPPDRHLSVLGVNLPLVHRSDGAHFAAALMQFLKAGRRSG